MFDQIAGTYDLTNRILSGRQDVRWRRSLQKHLPQNRPVRLLDLATGTGDQILHLLEAGARLENPVGLDMSKEMLEIGRQKMKARSLDSVQMIHGNACELPFEDKSFDVVTMSFGIRNVPDVPKCLREIARVLKPGGRALILEFGLPQNFVFRKGYLFYFRHVLPRLGGMISGNTKAYQYLNSSVEDFPYGESFVALMKPAGFSKVKVEDKFLGIACLYIGDKE